MFLLGVSSSVFVYSELRKTLRNRDANANNSNNSKIFNNCLYELVWWRRDGMFFEEKKKKKKMGKKDEDEEEDNDVFLIRLW